jgi:hypothetical protein
MHLNEDDLVLHYYGEMPSEEESRAAAHLASCSDCQQNYTTLQRVMAFVDSAPAVEAAPGFERIAWARLEPALAQSRRRGWVAWFLYSPSRLAFAAGVMLLIGAAFMAGRLTRTPGAAGASTPQSAAQVRERILLVDLGDHLDRSQMVLVELVSAGGSTGDVDISTERARAEQLVAVNRLYRQTALSTGDANMASLLDDLERVLVDIAASPATVSQEDLDLVRRRIDSKELLFKVRVVSSQVRARQKAAIQERTTQQALGS